MATQTANFKGAPAPSPSSQSGAPSAPKAQSQISEYRWIILLGLLTAAIMEVLDTTIINVALPQMAGNLGATSQEIAWVSTGYILSNVVVLPMTAFLAATFGRRRYLVASTVIFIVASFLCGTSHSLGELVLWRVIQGAGGAALLSTAQATLRQIFPQEQQALVQALFLMGIIVAPTLGPTLGGWITDNYTWNWCFFINVPIGIVSVFLIGTYLQDDPDAVRRTGKIDLLGIGLLAVGLSCLQYVLEEGQQDDWFNDPTIVRLSVISAVSLIGMFWWELSPKNKTPVVDFRVMKNRDLSAGLFLFIALGFGLYGGIYLYPLLAQIVFGFTPTTTGLTLLPGGLGTAASALICGRILSAKKPIVDARILIFFGVFIFAYSMWEMGHLTTSAGEGDVRMALLMRGFGLGFLFAPINNAVYGSINPKDAQQASGLINLARQLGGSFGIAILGTYLTNQTHYHRAELVSRVYNGSVLLQQRTQGLEANLRTHGLSATDAQHVALAQIDRSLMRQATILAYNNAWLLILVTFVCAAPAILLLRKPKSKPGAAVDAH